MLQVLLIIGIVYVVGVVIVATIQLLELLTKSSIGGKRNNKAYIRDFIHVSLMSWAVLVIIFIGWLLKKN